MLHHMVFSSKDVDPNQLNFNPGFKFWFKYVFSVFIFPLIISQLLPVQQRISLAALEGVKVSGLDKARDSLMTVIKPTNRSTNYAGSGEGESKKKSPKNKEGRMTGLIKSDCRAKCWRTTSLGGWSRGGALEPFFPSFLSSISEYVYSFPSCSFKHVTRGQTHRRTSLDAALSVLSDIKLRRCPFQRKHSHTCILQGLRISSMWGK